MNIDKIRVVIPAYNVGQHLAELLNCIKEYLPVEQVIIVDDGSIDHTSDIGVDFGTKVISFDDNQGKGVALRTGFQFAVSMNAEWIMTIDGDMQHDPKYIPDFLEQAGKGRYNLLIGARERHHGIMPWDRRFSNWSTSRFLGLITRQPITDAQCGYRLFQAGILESMKLRCRYYDLETEFLLKAIRKGANVGWIPISTKYQNEASSINRFKDTIRFMRVTTRFLFSGLRRSADV